jgi:hypothetical protein
MISNVARYMFGYLQIGLMLNLFYYFFNVPSLLLGIGIGISASKIHSFNSIVEIMNSPYVRLVIETVQFGSSLIMMNLNTISHGLYMYINSFFNKSRNTLREEINSPDIEDEENREENREENIEENIEENREENIEENIEENTEENTEENSEDLNQSEMETNSDKMD